MGTTESLPEDEGAGGEDGYGYDHHDAGGTIPEQHHHRVMDGGPTVEHQPSHSHAGVHRRRDHHPPGSGSGGPSDPAAVGHRHAGGNKPNSRRQHRRPSPRDAAAASSDRRHHHHHPSSPPAAVTTMRGRILGAKGTGKTCLLRRLRGEDPFDSSDMDGGGGAVAGAQEGRNGRDENVAVIPWRPSVVSGGGGGPHHRRGGGPVVRLHVSDDGGGNSDAAADTAGGDDDKAEGGPPGTTDHPCHFVVLCVDPRRPDTLRHAEGEARRLLDARFERDGGGGDDEEGGMDAATLPLPMCFLLNFRDLVDDDVEAEGTAGGAKPTSDDGETATEEDAPPTKGDDDGDDGEGGPKENRGDGDASRSGGGGGTDDDAVVANGEERRGGDDDTHLTMADVRAAVDRLRAHLAGLRLEYHKRSLERCVSGASGAATRTVVASPPPPPPSSGAVETIFAFESSMRDCYGLSVLHAFLNVPYHAVLGEADALRRLRATRVLASAAAGTVADEVEGNVAPGGYDDFREGLTAPPPTATTGGEDDDGGEVDENDGEAEAEADVVGGDRPLRGIPTEQQEESSRLDERERMELSEKRERMERLVEERRALQREAIEQRQRLAQAGRSFEGGASAEEPSRGERSSRRGTAKSKASLTASSSSSRAGRARVEDDPQRALDLFLADDSDEAHEDPGRRAGRSSGPVGSRGRGNRGAHSGRGYPRRVGVGVGEGSSSSSDDEDVYYDQEGRRRHALGDAGGGSGLSRLPVMGSNAGPSLSSFETRRGRETTADHTKVTLSPSATVVGGPRSSKPKPRQKGEHMPDNEGERAAIVEAPRKENNRSLERGDNYASPDGGKAGSVPRGENGGTSSSRFASTSMGGHAPQGGIEREDDQHKKVGVEATSSDHGEEGVEPELEELDSRVGRDNRDMRNEGSLTAVNRSKLLEARHTHAVAGPVDASFMAKESDDGDSDDFIVGDGSAVGIVGMRTDDAAELDDSDDEFVIGDVAGAPSPLVPPSSMKPLPLAKETAPSAGGPPQPSSSAVSKAALAAIAAAEEEARKAMDAAMLASTAGKEKGERKERKKKKKDKKEKHKKGKKKDRIKETS